MYFERIVAAPPPHMYIMISRMCGGKREENKENQNNPNTFVC